jgi:homoserine dehydrogenase
MSEAVGITLLGCGVVGSGVVRILNDQRELLRRRTGLTFDLRHVVVRDPKKHVEHVGALPLTTDATAAIDDPRTRIVTELLGGTNSAGELIQRALRLGKPVVTANKSLLAEQGPQLFALAREHKTCIAFEASCGGGIPIIGALAGGLVANRIDALVGIVNGTSNVILTQMTRSGSKTRRNWASPRRTRRSTSPGATRRRSSRCSRASRSTSTSSRPTYTSKASTAWSRPTSNSRASWGT